MIEVDDSFKIDLETEHTEPCCMDNCTRAPTFKFSLFEDERFVGEFFICKLHYEICSKRPGFLLGYSSLIKKIIGE